MPAYNLTITLRSDNGTLTQMVMLTEKDYQVHWITYTATSESFPIYQNDFSKHYDQFVCHHELIARAVRFPNFITGRLTKRDRPSDCAMSE
jgi:vesicle coat complex subunit